MGLILVYMQFDTRVLLNHHFKQYQVNTRTSFRAQQVSSYTRMLIHVTSLVHLIIQEKMH